MNETKYRITITNLDEAQKKADELVRSLQQAKQLIRDISESPLNVEVFDVEETGDLLTISRQNCCWPVNKDGEYASGNPIQTSIMRRKALDAAFDV